MQVGMSAVWRMAVVHWVCLVAVACLAVAVWLLRQQVRVHVAERRRDRRVREEIEAYARLDARLPADGDMQRFEQDGVPDRGGEEPVLQGGNAGAGRGGAAVCGGQCGYGRSDCEGGAAVGRASG